MKKNDNKIQYLLSEEQLSDVSNILDSHIHSLRKIKRFKELEKEMFDLSDIISKKLEKEDQEKFDKLSYVLGEMEAYTNALLYSLGIKYGIELKNL